MVRFVNSTSGRGGRGETIFMTLKAYLTGTGLLSRDSAAVSGAATAASRWARAIWPCFQTRYMARQRPGATFEVPEMQPSPPLARKAGAVASSPDNNRKPGLSD